MAQPTRRSSLPRIRHKPQRQVGRTTLTRLFGRSPPLVWAQQTYSIFSSESTGSVGRLNSRTDMRREDGRERCLLHSSSGGHEYCAAHPIRKIELTLPPCNLQSTASERGRMEPLHAMPRERVVNEVWPRNTPLHHRLHPPQQGASLKRNVSLLEDITVQKAIKSSVGLLFDQLPCRGVSKRFSYMVPSFSVLFNHSDTLQHAPVSPRLPPCQSHGPFAIAAALIDRTAFAVSFRHSR